MPHFLTPPFDYPIQISATSDWSVGVTCEEGDFAVVAIVHHSVSGSISGPCKTLYWQLYYIKYEHTIAIIFIKKAARSGFKTGNLPHNTHLFISPKGQSFQEILIKQYIQDQYRQSEHHRGCHHIIPIRCIV